MITMNLYFTSLHEVSMSKFKLFTKVCVSLLFPFLCLLVVSCSGESSDNVDNPNPPQECTDPEITGRCGARDNLGG